VLEAATDHLDLPIGLKTVLETGSAVLFLGAGVTHNAADGEGRPPPTSEQLAREVAAEFDVEYEGDPELAKIAEVAMLRTYQRAIPW
jgi:hypothetical protein